MNKEVIRFGVIGTNNITEWYINGAALVKGYIFNATYSSDARTQEIMVVRVGNCSSERKGGEYLAPAYPGDIRAILEICS